MVNTQWCIYVVILKQRALFSCVLFFWEPAAVSSRTHLFGGRISNSAFQTFLVRLAPLHLEQVFRKMSSWIPLWQSKPLSKDMPLTVGKRKQEAFKFNSLIAFLLKQLIRRELSEEKQGLGLQSPYCRFLSECWTLQCPIAQCFPAYLSLQGQFAVPYATDSSLLSLSIISVIEQGHN